MRRFLTHQMNPKVPEGEVWINSRLPEEEKQKAREEALATFKPVLYQSTAEVIRNAPAQDRMQALAELLKPEPQQMTVQVSAPTVQYYAPEEHVPDVHMDLSELAGSLDRQTQAFHSLAEVLRYQKAPEVQAPDMNPIAQAIHVMSEKLAENSRLTQELIEVLKRPRKVVRDSTGKLTGVE